MSISHQQDPILASVETDPDTQAYTPELNNRNGLQFDSSNLSKFYESIPKHESDNLKSRLSVSQSSELYSMPELSSLLRSPNLKSSYSPVTIPGFSAVSSVEIPVETISSSWIQLKIMKQLAPFNPVFINCIDSLDIDHHIAGWKKSRGDGNCYYRAVISRYLEMLMHPYAPLANLAAFIVILKNLSEVCRLRQDIDQLFITALDYILNCMNNLKEQKEENALNSFSMVIYWMQDQEFDINLVRVARLLTFVGFIDSEQELEHFAVSKEAIMNYVLKMGEEAEEFVLMLLPLKLGIQVVQYNLFQKVNVESFPNQEEKVIKVNIIRRGGHYDILYTKNEMEYDMYNFDKGTYYFINSS